MIPSLEKGKEEGNLKFKFPYLTLLSMLAGSSVSEHKR